MLLLFVLSTFVMKAEYNTITAHIQTFPSLFRPSYLRHSFMFWGLFSASKNVLLLDHIMCLKLNVRSDMSNNTSDAFGQQMWATSHGTEEQIERHVCSLCVSQQHVISLQLPSWKVLTSGRRQPVWPPLNKTPPDLESDVCQLLVQHGGCVPACTAQSDKSYENHSAKRIWTNSDVPSWQDGLAYSCPCL